MQTPRLVFQDAELQKGTAASNCLGLPVVWSGNFASVYRLHTPNHIWAVRCFLGRLEDRQQRYQSIHEHLGRHSLPSLVKFEYLKEGIVVGGSRYPILKMEWVEGEPLLDYVKNHLGEPERLRKLAERLRHLVEQMQAVSVAHGDLQHGNILIVNHHPFLIDYDGLYVPALQGRPPGEIGHANYQSPRRQRQHYGPNMDAFSLAVLNAGLLGLAADPTLWKRYQHHDSERLLFRQNDFHNPERSELLADLQRLPDESLRETLQWLRKALQMEPTDLQLFRSSPTPLGLDWLRDHTDPRPAPASVQKVRPVGVSWLSDHHSPRDDPLRQELSRLEQQAREMDRKTWGDQWAAIEYHLRRIRIEPGAISRIGPALCTTLADYSIRTAADVDLRVAQVPGVGPILADRLLEWRTQAIEYIVARLPAAQRQAPTPPRTLVRDLQRRYSQGWQVLKRRA